MKPRPKACSTPATRAAAAHAKLAPSFRAYLTASDPAFVERTQHDRHGAVAKPRQWLRSKQRMQFPLRAGPSKAPSPEASSSDRFGEAIIARYEKMERGRNGHPGHYHMPPVLESPVHAPDALHKMLNPSPATPPKIPATSGPTVDDRLQRLADLFGKKLISQAEYDAKRQQILGEL